MTTLAEQVLNAAKTAGLKIATAESCTGGMIAAALTDIAGSSDVFDRGFITYSNAAKIKQLGVLPATLEKFGAVSAEVAKEMVLGCLAASDSDITVSVTGIAGPGGATATKPVGLVYIGVGRKGRKPDVVENKFSGDRSSVRLQSLEMALNLLLKALTAT
jgi:nicotinamide-nucleotide amidase